MSQSGASGVSKLYFVAIATIIINLSVTASADSSESAKKICNQATSCYKTIVANADNKSPASIKQEKRKCDALKASCERQQEKLSKLAKAYRDYQIAYKRYTKMVTSVEKSDSENINKALNDYKQSYARYIKLKGKQKKSQPATQKNMRILDTSGIDGIVDIEPKDVTREEVTAKQAAKRDKKSNSLNTNKRKPAVKPKTLVSKVQLNLIQQADKYRYGIGIAANQPKAFTLYKKAADKGNLDAMVELSGFYQDGIWVQRNLKKSMHLLKKASKAGSLSAKWQLEMLKGED